METAGAGNPTAILSGPPGDPTRGVTPAPRRRPSIGLPDDEKTGAVLLFSGLFLTLAGATFTAMGWHRYRANPDFEWSQLLGPVLISAGGTLVLTSVCRFGVIWPCIDWDKEAMERTSTGRSFSLSAVSQPTVLYDATAMVCFPPQYNFITQEVRQAGGFQAGGFQAGGFQAGGFQACPPPYACVDNAAFTAGEEETDPGRSRIQRTNERGCGDESDAACSPPPAYEDICPSFNQHHGT